MGKRTKRSSDACRSGSCFSSSFNRRASSSDPSTSTSTGALANHSGRQGGRGAGEDCLVLGASKFARRPNWTSSSIADRLELDGVGSSESESSASSLPDAAWRLLRGGEENGVVKSVSNEAWLLAESNELRELALSSLEWPIIEVGRVRTGFRKRSPSAGRPGCVLRQGTHLCLLLSPMPAFLSFMLFVCLWRTWRHHIQRDSTATFYRAPWVASVYLSIADHPDRGSNWLGNKLPTRYGAWPSPNKQRLPYR
jgi:hypothetical protein